MGWIARFQYPSAGCASFVIFHLYHTVSGGFCKGWEDSNRKSRLPGKSRDFRISAGLFRFRENSQIFLERVKNRCLTQEFHQAIAARRNLGGFCKRDGKIQRTCHVPTLLLARIPRRRLRRKRLLSQCSRSPDRYTSF